MRQWLCCWFSPLLRGVFIQVLRFSPLQKKKKQHFQIAIRFGLFLRTPKCRNNQHPYVEAEAEG